MQHLAGQVIHSADRSRMTSTDLAALLNQQESYTYNPYVMGETLLGSSDPTNPVAPNADLTIARTDTWSVDTPPLDIGSAQTFGVDVYPIRIYSNVGDGGNIPAGDAVTWDGSYVWIFLRKLRYDERGRLSHVGIEELVGVHYDATHGSTLHSTIINR